MRISLVEMQARVLEAVAAFTSFLLSLLEDLIGSAVLSTRMNTSARRTRRAFEQHSALIKQNERFFTLDLSITDSTNSRPRP